MLYILWGEDEFSIEETLQGIKNSLGDMSLLSTNMNVLDGQKLAVNDLKAVSEAMPFLALKRLVIVKGLLERFEAKDKPGRVKKNGSSALQDECRLIAECIKSTPASTILVLVDNLEMKKSTLQNNPLFNVISASADVKSYPQMKGIKLSQWIQARVTQLGGSISRQGTELLMEIIGGDLYTMSHEIEKLVAFTGGRFIEEKDIRAVVSASREADIFAMVDAILDHQSGKAMQILQKLLQNGTAPPQILVLLARQIGILVQVKEMKSQKKPAMEIQSKVGIFNPFAWEKVSGRAGKYTLEKLREIYNRLLETDLAIKTGRFDGDLALDILVAQLCQDKTS